MMDYLITMADQIRPGLQSLLRSALGEDGVRGALLEVDRFWIEAYARKKFPGYPEYPYTWAIQDLGSFLQDASLVDPVTWDFTFRPVNPDYAAGLAGVA